MTKPRLKYIHCHRGGMTAHNAKAIMSHQTPGRLIMRLSTTIIQDPGLTYRIPADLGFMLVCRRMG